MFRRLTCFLILFFVALIGCGRPDNAGKSTGSMQVKGSDTMVNLGQAWAEAFMKKNQGTNIAVTGGGSGTGIAALINGTCDIAESSRIMKDKEKEMAKAKGHEAVEFIVGLDGLAVVVHPSNPVSKLTIDQLASIYTGSITNWKQVGGTDSKIVLLSREVNSGTHVYFKEHVVRKGNEKGPEEFASHALLMTSSQAIADEVAQNKSAIGYYGMGYISPKQKALEISKDGKTFVKPANENVKNGSYPISRPMFFYTVGEPKGLVKKYVDFVLSPEGQEVVKRLDFVPVR